MNFVMGRLFDGLAFQTLTVVDNFSQKSPLIEVAQSMTSRQVILALERTRRLVDLSSIIIYDNGSQFTSLMLDS